jgi:lipid II:glycine glycyltransferase (peptidoglycan interpeptide bridge formation enzyme)
LGGEFPVSDNWKFFEGSDSDWDDLLKQLGQMCVFQSSRWARHKSSTGWSAARIVKKTGDSQIAIQCLVRKGPFGIAMAWAPGGFAGDLSLTDKVFASSLKKLLKSRFLYIRFGMMIDFTSRDASLLANAGFRKSKNPIGARQSMLLSIHSDQESMLSTASSNWKRNHKRSLRTPSSPYVWNDASPEQLEAAYQAMDEFKKVEGVKLHMSASDIRNVQECFGHDLVLIRMDDENGKLLSVRGALVHQSTAWDFIAVTTPDGRKTYSSHRTLLALAQECARRGCTTLELGGIDPEKNKGVFDFKNGTGARITTYLGEWETANPSLIRPVISRIVSAKAQ